ncbi:MAG: GIY-YIG nuclease family protein [bacterium]|nr:GIY-YIG nuclease family protein [bacterium]
MYQEKISYIYIMASGKNGTLYIGVTSNLQDRVNKHKQGLFGGFTKKYNIIDLVYYEIFGDIQEAFTREKQLKKWKRNWKIKLIEKDNPGWNDLSDKLF